MEYLILHELMCRYEVKICLTIFISSHRFLLFIVSVLEITSGAAIFDQARGSGRQSGDFSFDPLNLGLDKNKRERYALSEIKNGRLAMLAISGILTQQAVFTDLKFPFL
jgi:Chlorophyll A-B binding protein